MKKYFFMLLMAVAAVSANAQNVQLHYDFGRNIYSDEEAGRQKVTMTLEQFKADKWGSWYYFVDIDFSRKFTEGAYGEISREFNIGNKGFAAHVEYDGGLNRFRHLGLELWWLEHPHVDVRGSPCVPCRCGHRASYLLALLRLCLYRALHAYT